MNPSQTKTPNNNSSPLGDTDTRPRRKARVFLAGLVAVLALVLWFHSIWMTAMAEFLLVSTPLEPADVVVVLGGGGTHRLDRGIELYKQGFSKSQKLIITGGSVGSDIFAQGTWAGLGSVYATGKGISAENIVQADWTESTYDDVQAVRDFMGKQGYSSAIFISDIFHMRRTQWIANKVMPGYNLMFSPARSPFLRTEEWWTREREFLFVTQEYVKFGLYMAKYGL